MILFNVALRERVRFSNAFTLGRSRSTAQLNVGNRTASKCVTNTIRRFMAHVLEDDQFRNRVKVRSDSFWHEAAATLELPVVWRRPTSQRALQGPRRHFLLDKLLRIASLRKC